MKKGTIDEVDLIYRALLGSFRFAIIAVDRLEGELDGIWNRTIMKPTPVEDRYSLREWDRLKEWLFSVVRQSIGEMDDTEDGFGIRRVFLGLLLLLMMIVILNQSIEFLNPPRSVIELISIMGWINR